MDGGDKERIQNRSGKLLPEEMEAGSDDPKAQAEAILEESDERSEDRIAPSSKPVEQRRSEDTVEPEQEDNSR